MKAAAKYVAIAEKHCLSPAELAIAFSCGRDCNTSFITGTTTVRQVEECVKACMIDLGDEVRNAYP